MLTAKEYGFLGNCRLEEDGVAVGELKMRRLKGPLLHIHDQTYEIMQAIESGSMRIELSYNGRALLQVKTPTRLTGTPSYTFEYEQNTFTIEFSEAKCFAVTRNGVPSGAVTLAKTMSRTIEIDVPDAEPVFVRLFLFFLVLTWLR